MIVPQSELRTSFRERPLPAGLPAALGQRRLAVLAKAALLKPCPSVTALLDATLDKYAGHPPR